MLSKCGQYRGLVLEWRHDRALRISCKRKTICFARRKSLLYTSSGTSWSFKKCGSTVGTKLWHPCAIPLQTLFDYDNWKSGKRGPRQRHTTKQNEIYTADQGILSYISKNKITHFEGILSLEVAGKNSWNARKYWRHMNICPPKTNENGKYGIIALSIFWIETCQMPLSK